MKKAGIFDPYFETVGGGEVYIGTVAKFLLKNGFAVDILWKDRKIAEDIKKFLGIDLERAQVSSTGFDLYSQKGSLFQKWQFGRSYDFMFFVSDGSIPALFSKNNILHFQIPFNNVNGSSLLNQIKLRNIQHIICNSIFTKHVIDVEYAVNSQVIYPPLNIKPPKRKKEKIILSVGRFTETLHNKRQDILIEAFKDLVNQGIKEWQLVLAGSSKEGKDIIPKLKEQAKGYPIIFKVDIRHAELEEEYGKATLFWHAAGFGVDQEKNPEQVEHFGIVTAEAMSAGCIPIVINKGGQPEIVKNGENGYLWKSPESLKKLTLQLIRSPEKMKTISTAALRASRKFSKDRFCQEFSRLLDL